MRISDWSSDVCSSDLVASERIFGTAFHVAVLSPRAEFSLSVGADALGIRAHSSQLYNVWCALKPVVALAAAELAEAHGVDPDTSVSGIAKQFPDRSEEHTSELQSLMRISYAVFCLKKKKQKMRNA